MGDVDLGRAVYELHSEVTLTVTTERLPSDQIAGRATLAGEDFLDGPWEMTRQGKEQDIRDALAAGAAAFHKPKKRRRWWR